MKWYLLFSVVFSSITFTLQAQQEKLPVEDFFRRPVVGQAILSPSGDMLVYEKVGSVYVGSQTVPYTDVYGVNNRFYIQHLEWLSEDVLAIQTRNKSSGKIGTMILELAYDESGVTEVRRDFIDVQGYIVDRLPNQPNAILFAQYRWNDDKVFSDVHKYPLFADKPYRFQKRSKFNANSGKIIEWVTDQGSRLRAGISYEDNKPILWSRQRESSRKMKSIWTGDEDTYFNIYGVDENNTKLWVITDYQRDKRAAVVFDLASASVTEVIYEHPERDVRSIVMAGDGQAPIAVTYLEQGRLNRYFIDPEAQRVYEVIAAQEETLNHTVFDSSADASSMIIARYGDNNPGQLLYCSKYGQACNAFESLFPWLDDVTLSNKVVFETAINDQYSIEAFLSYPAHIDLNDANSVPLIIMPHGGPIGVYDTQYLTGDVEWLVHNGYAVLRVNYRGSGGYGRDFEQQGMQQWGRAIEDDINAAVQNAFSSYAALDQDRVCLFGGSYGGYSAVMGVLREPDTYKCAVSFAGVMDLPLLFNTSSVQNNELLTEKLKEIIGDPSVQMEELKSYSPVYNAQNIQTPIMLIHGTKDRIVDVEHTWRMSHMLSMYGIEHRREIMRNSGHSFTSTDEVKQMYEWVMPFFHKHLKKPAVHRTSETAE
ncbi:prolyl oligopeptidase family serine peptidase [Alteromonas sp. ASW11-36]|uniref:Prolyl oligopeptidase family serine peptidase n=1 Tax=Alteromonas arenosi TaxID=3055817 RepID=A0ABT7SVT9_9ALTE|nr:prolyl oligopeptidase family serine peptidase [Alteromonas sp. ASW11-36]MDM7860303.1 prolyl oligopeptidase family serine peptidase [Alteromonas sp. ASW11-36]